MKIPDNWAKEKWFKDALIVAVIIVKIKYEEPQKNIASKKLWRVLYHLSNRELDYNKFEILIYIIDTYLDSNWLENNDREVIEKTINNFDEITMLEKECLVKNIQDVFLKATIREML